FTSAGIWSTSHVIMWCFTPRKLNQNSERRFRTFPLKGMPLAITTSNALMRSLVTMSSESPRSNMSRTLPLVMCFRPGRLGLVRMDSVVGMALSLLGCSNEFGQFAGVARDVPHVHFVSWARERLDRRGLDRLAGARLERERDGGGRRAQDLRLPEQRGGAHDRARIGSG